MKLSSMKTSPQLKTDLSLSSQIKEVLKSPAIKSICELHETSAEQIVHHFSSLEEQKLLSYNSQSWKVTIVPIIWNPLGTTLPYLFIKEYKKFSAIKDTKKFVEALDKALDNVFVEDWFWEEFGEEWIKNNPPRKLKEVLNITSENGWLIEAIKNQRTQIFEMVNALETNLPEQWLFEYLYNKVREVAPWKDLDLSEEEKYRIHNEISEEIDNVILKSSAFTITYESESLPFIKDTINLLVDKSISSNKINYEIGEILESVSISDITQKNKLDYFKAKLALLSLMNQEMIESTWQMVEFPVYESEEFYIWVQLVVSMENGTVKVRTSKDHDCACSAHYLDSDEISKENHEVITQISNELSVGNLSLQQVKLILEKYKPIYIWEESYMLKENKDFINFFQDVEKSPEKYLANNSWVMGN